MASKEFVAKFLKSLEIVSFEKHLSSKTFGNKKSNFIFFPATQKSQTKSVLSTESCMKIVMNFCVLSCLNLNAVSKKGCSQRLGIYAGVGLAALLLIEKILTP